MVDSTENTQKAKFCTQCGTKIGSVRVCPQCGAVNYFLEIPYPSSVWGTPEDSRIIHFSSSGERSEEVAQALPTPVPKSLQTAAEESSAVGPSTIPEEKTPIAPPLQPITESPQPDDEPVIGSDSIFDFLGSSPSESAPQPFTQAPAPEVAPPQSSPPEPSLPQLDAQSEKEPIPEETSPKEAALPPHANSTFNFLGEDSKNSSDDIIPDPLAPAKDAPREEGTEEQPADFGGTFFMDDLSAPEAQPPKEEASTFKTDLPPAVLVRTSPPDSGRIHKLKTGQNQIGTLIEGDLHLLKQENRGVSRRHAQIDILVTANGEVQSTIQDMGSLNGTFVNGERITKAVPIVSGDEIRFANIKFTYETQ